MFTVCRLELDLSGRDVSNRTTRINEPSSTDDQFLTLSLSDLTKDGGQATIPFIDTQKVETNPLSPLSGISFYHKGQPGFGGYMGLKLLTYNLTSQIDPEFKLDKSIMVDGVEKLKKFLSENKDKMNIGRSSGVDDETIETALDDDIESDPLLEQFNNLLKKENIFQ